MGNGLALPQSEGSCWVVQGRLDFEGVLKVQIICRFQEVHRDPGAKHVGSARGGQC